MDTAASSGERLTAGFYYEIRVVRESIGRARKLGRMLLAVARQFIPIYGDLDNLEPRLRTTVLVVRKHDGKVVVDYEYNRESDALLHVSSLRVRLQHQTFTQFSRELGIRDL